MVFGNMGDDSGTGVAFTRDPSTGEPELYGEFLVNAQGEDVVAGIRDPLPIDGWPRRSRRVRGAGARRSGPAGAHYRDVQDLEFTVERGTLYLLQTRTAKRTGRAAVRIGGGDGGRGADHPEEAVLRVRPEQLDQLLHPMVDPDAEVQVLTTGLPASPGAASGGGLQPRRGGGARRREPVILVRRETSPEDFHGMVRRRGSSPAAAG
jgi:pyruvate, orthophosphate dikinase